MPWQEKKRRLAAVPALAMGVALLLGWMPCALSAQSGTSEAVASDNAPRTAGSDSLHIGMNAAAEAGSVRLTLNPGDEADITVYGIPDMSQHVRVSESGAISLPLVGVVQVAGLTTEQAAAAIQQKLAAGGFVRDPHVSVYVKEFNSQRVAISGEVVRPGLYPVLSSPRLYDLFLAAGGLTNRAGSTVTLTHASDPQKASVVMLSSDPAKSAEANLRLEAGDSVVVSKAGVVYVMGEVNRPGGFVIEDNQPISLLRAVAMAAGPTRMASLGHARIIRRTPNGIDSQDVDLKKVLQAKSQDQVLSAEDILFIPSSRSKAAIAVATGSAVSVATQLAIYRF